MEIEQYLYELTDSGEAIIAYKMVSESGSVELCNMGASILSYSIGGVEIASGQAVRSLTNPTPTAEKSLAERIWNSWVEGNRVIMSTVEQIGELSLTIELVFDYDDDNTLEITYQAIADGELLVDLTHLFTLDMGGEVAIERIDSTDSSEIRAITSARKNILGEVATIAGSSIRVELLSSHPALYVKLPQIATIAHPNTHLVEGERYIQKTLFRAYLG
ncbi:MAG: hypothetical protein SNG35_05690 [Rikenellaceae bacterium]